MKLTPEQLAEVSKRAEAATPGPWSFANDPMEDLAHIYEFCEFCEDDPPIATVNPHGTTEDASFIATVRSDVPALLLHIEALEKENASLREALAQWKCHNASTSYCPVDENSGAPCIYCHGSGLDQRAARALRAPDQAYNSPWKDPAL